MLEPDDYEQLLERAGFTLAAGPLREMFELDGITDPKAQYELAFYMIVHTMRAMAVLTKPKPRTVH